MIPTFLTISDSDVTSTIAYASDFMADMMPLLMPIIGLMIGILIFWAIVSVVRK